MRCLFNCLFLAGGPRAETSTRVKARDGYNSEGVSGLRALGVRDLPYRLSFLCCAVQDTKPGVGEGEGREGKVKGGIAG